MMMNSSSSQIKPFDGKGEIIQNVLGEIASGNINLEHVFVPDKGTRIGPWYETRREAVYSIMSQYAAIKKEDSNVPRLRAKYVGECFGIEKSAMTRITNCIKQGKSINFRGGQRKLNRETETMVSDFVTHGGNNGRNPDLGEAKTFANLAWKCLGSVADHGGPTDGSTDVHFSTVYRMVSDGDLFSIKTPKSIPHSKKESVTCEIFESLFDILDQIKAFASKKGLDMIQVNLDEKPVSIDRSEKVNNGRKVVTTDNLPAYRDTASSSGSKNTCLLVTADSRGYLWDCVVIGHSKTQEELTKLKYMDENGIEQLSRHKIMYTQNGYISRKHFLTIFEGTIKGELERLSKDNVVVLLMDNAGHHVVPQIEEWFRSHDNVFLIYLPKNTTQHLQPLDNHPFGVFTKKFNVLQRKYIDGTKKTVPRKEVINMCVNVLNDMTSKVWQKGFYQVSKEHIMQTPLWDHAKSGSERKRRLKQEKLEQMKRDATKRAMMNAMLAEQWRALYRAGDVQKRKEVAIEIYNFNGLDPHGAYEKNVLAETSPEAHLEAIRASSGEFKKRKEKFLKELDQEALKVVCEETKVFLQPYLKTVDSSRKKKKTPKSSGSHPVNEKKKELENNYTLEGALEKVDILLKKMTRIEQACRLAWKPVDTLFKFLNVSEKVYSGILHPKDNRDGTYAKVIGKEEALEDLDVDDARELDQVMFGEKKEVDPAATELASQGQVSAPQKKRKEKDSTQTQTGRRKRHSSRVKRGKQEEGELTDLSDSDNDLDLPEESDSVSFDGSQLPDTLGPKVNVSSVANHSPLDQFKNPELFRQTKRTSCPTLKRWKCGATIIEIAQSDIDTIRGSGENKSRLLNDQVIMAVGARVQTFSEENELPPVFPFDSLKGTCLVEEASTEQKRILAQYIMKNLDDILTCSTILFPLNLRGNHWALVKVQPKKKEVMYLDSMEPDRNFGKKICQVGVTFRVIRSMIIFPLVPYVP